MRLAYALLGLFTCSSLVQAGGTSGPAVLAPPPLAPRPLRELRVAAASGTLILALVTDENRYSSGRGLFTARQVTAWRWSGGTWQPLGGVLNYQQPRPAANLNLAVDPQGTPVLAWNENSGDNDVVVFRAWQAGQWTNWWPRYLGISSPQAAKTRALAAWQGEPVLVWGERPRQGPGILLTLRRWTGQEWARGEPLGTPSRSPREPSVALDARGQITVAWLEGSVTASRVRVARQVGDHWEALGAPLSRGGPAYLAAPRLALDQAGRPVLAWLEDVDGQDTLFVSRWTGTRWVPLGQAVSTGFASAPSLALGAQGQPVLAWVEERGGRGQVRLARWTGAAWRDLGVLNADARRDARSPSVAVLPSGEAVLAWREDGGGIYRLHLRRFAP
ncbi:hypothetical protein [Deinococcus sp. YIM 77859]|uniref:hypothetical protein n=1 Tax=Deinococcus sp. YIM 77859 TaxID=1540221 RepID=UPI000557ED55|nr:hypothetical protein [Deinococcus sp. YIM 77859]